MVKYKKVHYGYYEVSRSGIIRRVKAGIGTYPGRVLKPYNPGNGSVEYISFSRFGKRSQYKLEDIIRRVWK
jgi:hypothetical protein